MHHRRTLCEKNTAEYLTCNNNNNNNSDNNQDSVYGDAIMTQLESLRESTRFTR